MRTLVSAALASTDAVTGARPCRSADPMLAGFDAATSEGKAMIEAQQRSLDRHPGATLHPIIHDRGPNLMRSIMERLLREEV